MQMRHRRFRNILQIALKLDHVIQRALQIGFDALAIFGALAGAMFLRLELFTFLHEPKFFISYALVLVPTLTVFAKMGLYRVFMRYVSTEIAVLVAFGSCISAITLIFTKVTVAPFIPWSIPIIYVALLFIAVTGSRFTLRAMFRSTSEKRRKYIAIYGAGAAGAQLLQSLTSSPDYRVQIILDDNPHLQGHHLFGLRVMSFEEAAENFEALEIDFLLLTMPSASITERNNIIFKLNNYSLEVKTIPAVSSLINGSAQITEFKDIALEDLLGRERVDPLPELLGKNISQKVVLVTGAGGSIGSELCRQIITLLPRQLILLDISELAIYNIVAELESQAQKLQVTLIPRVGSVEDRAFVSSTMAQQNIDTVFHAAAYKHVPLMEQNIYQAIKNNSLGTLVLADESVRSGVSHFTLISTDKAVNPTNVMGSSKRLAERICQTINNEQSATRFSMVRFGNVLGSSGSVVPLFKKQIAEGGPITLTHPDVVRYFMTTNEAVQLLIQASSLAKGGEVFVLDMGIPVKIKDLAFKMARLSGLQPYLEGDSTEGEGNIAVRISGLRPGEKMYEELSHGNNLIGTKHPRVMMINEKAMKSQDMRKLMADLVKLVTEQDHRGLLNCLIKNADYAPYDAQLEEKSNTPTSKTVAESNKILPFQ